MTTLPPGVSLHAPVTERQAEILTTDALALVARLHRRFESRRQELLAARTERQVRLDAGERPDFLAATRAIRESEWTIAPLPKALECRRVEITGPVERKMIINALNSGADSYMSDFEDSNTPTWDNQLDGQLNIRDAVRGEPCAGREREPVASRLGERREALTHAAIGVGRRVAVRGPVRALLALEAHVDARGGLAGDEVEHVGGDGVHGLPLEVVGRAFRRRRAVSRAAAA